MDWEQVAGLSPLREPQQKLTLLIGITPQNLVKLAVKVGSERAETYGTGVI